MSSVHRQDERIGWFDASSIGVLTKCIGKDTGAVRMYLYKFSPLTLDRFHVIRGFPRDVTIAEYVYRMYSFI